MTINGETLRRYRESKNFSQSELKERSGVSKKTISRIELGEVTRPNKETKRRLAKALEIDVSDLAKPAGEREKIEQKLKKDGYRKLNGYIDSETAIAYAMVQHRYGVSTDTLIKMAPLFFTMLAEGSLAWRKRKVKEISPAIETLSSVSSGAPHLAYASAVDRIDEALCDEEKSIAEHDLFGKNISEEAYDFGFDLNQNNPFADYLRCLCKDIDESALEIDPLGQGEWKADDCMPDYHIAPDDFEVITDGDEWAKFAIERGHARISEIPAELFKPDQRIERVEWIVSHIPEAVRKEHQAWLDSLAQLNLDSLNLGNVEESND
jgi:transcriptional regulator with XRE-family HTH domain